MRLEWLDDILAVAETGSLSDAAERRRLTQSAFSRRIQNIEDYVGVELFDRSRKPVQLRPTTAAQQDQIAKLAGDLRQLLADLREGDRITGNRVVIASQHALTTALTPDLIRRIGAEFPEAYIRLRSANLDDCFGLILGRQADIALVYRWPGAQHPIEADYIETLPLGPDRLIPVFAYDRVAELNRGFESGHLPVIAYPSEVFLGQVLERRLLPQVRRVTRIEAKAETALTLAALELATVGIGVAWVPASLAQSQIDTGVLADLSASLAACPLEVTAVRVRGSASAPGGRVWAELQKIATDPGMDQALADESGLSGAPAGR